jgi:hypothetical protein
MKLAENRSGRSHAHGRRQDVTYTINIVTSNLLKAA